MKTKLQTRIQCASGSLRMNGETFDPDHAKAYFEFWCAHCFPVVTSDGCAVHPSVIAKSHQSLRHQIVNLGHLMESYGTSDSDRNLGAVVAVEYPPMPEGGWVVPKTVEAAPGVHGIGVLHRAVRGVPVILGQQYSGERNWTVSMEFAFDLHESAFLVRQQDCARFACQVQGPEDLLSLGWSCIEYQQAPPMLQSTLVSGKPVIAPEYRGMVVFLTGGLRGQALFEGLALTLLGKEPTARTGSFTAAMDDPNRPEVAIALMERLMAITGDALKA